MKGREREREREGERERDIFGRKSAKRFRSSGSPTINRIFFISQVSFKMKPAPKNFGIGNFKITERGSSCKTFSFVTKP